MSRPSPEDPSTQLVATPPVAAPAALAGIDPRGPRFTAAVTTVVLAASLLLGSWQLLALQAVVFALGVGLGPGRQPYGVIFRGLVRPRLQPPAQLEDQAAPRFAQDAASRSPLRASSATPSAGRRWRSARQPWRWPPHSSTQPSTSASAARST